MSIPTSLYTAVAEQIDKHVNILIEKINGSADLKFLQLRFTRLLTTVFTKLLAFLAALYEFANYCMTLQFLQITSNI